MTDMKTLELSESTSAFLDAVKALSAAEDAVWDALTLMYGDDDANTHFSRIPFEDVRNAVAKYVYHSLEEQL